MLIRPAFHALIVCCTFTTAPTLVFADEAASENGSVIPLWIDGAPGFEDRKDEPEKVEGWSISNIHNPSLTVFLPPKEKANGVGVIVVPGGGLRKLGFSGGGVEPAKYLNEIGVAAFVLKYRLSREEGSPYKFEEHVREDGERAMRLVRSRAEEFGVDPDKLGMLGFSAGGEVVSIVSYRGGKGKADAADPVDRLNSKPDFQMLVYPGPLGIPSKLPADSPPAFMLIAADDNHASVLLNLMARFREVGVDYEAHIYARGGHGFGMGNRSKGKGIQNWTERMADWIHDEVLESR